jgi:hypothetical protein
MTRPIGRGGRGCRKRQANGYNKVVGLHAWRISEDGFLRFIRSWAEWIEKAGVTEHLNNDRALDAAE